MPATTTSATTTRGFRKGPPVLKIKILSMLQVDAYYASMLDKVYKCKALNTDFACLATFTGEDSAKVQAAWKALWESSGPFTVEVHERGGKPAMQLSITAAELAGASLPQRGVKTRTVVVPQ